MHLGFSGEGMPLEAGQVAADWWDSAPFSSIFLASGFFLLPNRIHARPHAGNANRWAAKAGMFYYILICISHIGGTK
jgi:hypothetical protein